MGFPEHTYTINTAKHVTKEHVSPRAALPAGAGAVSTRLRLRGDAVNASL